MSVLLRTTGLVESPNATLIPRDVSNEIIKLRPARSTVLTMMMGLGMVKTVKSREFTVNTQPEDPVEVTVTAVPDGTHITVSSADGLLIDPGMYLTLNPSVIALVTANADGALTVDDSTGFSAEDIVLCANRAYEENSSKPAAITRAPDHDTNYLETARDSWGQSRWVETEDYYGPPRQAENREMAMWEHKRFIERGILLNAKFKGTQNGKRMYKTDGLVQQIARRGNSKTFGSGQVKLSTMLTFMEDCGRYTDTDTLWAVGGRTALNVMRMVAYNKTVPNETKSYFGITLEGIQLGDKKIKLIATDHFRRGYANTVLILDPSQIDIVTAANRETGAKQWMMEETDAKVPGDDGTFSVLTSDFGVRIKNHLSCSIWNSVTTATAES